MPSGKMMRPMFQCVPKSALQLSRKKPAYLKYPSKPRLNNSPTHNQAFEPFPFTPGSRLPLTVYARCCNWQAQKAEAENKTANSTCSKKWSTRPIKRVSPNGIYLSRSHASKSKPSAAIKRESKSDRRITFSRIRTNIRENWKKNLVCGFVLK